MADRRRMVAGNWKLNGSRNSAAELARSVASGANGLDVEVVVCPTHVHLADVLLEVGNSPVRLGAQTCAEYESGAYTGEVAAAMLVEFGVEYVIVGHSERRALFHESSESTAHRAQAILSESMTPIVCVGETLEERQAGRTEAVLADQLAPVFSTLSQDQLADIVIAYEPVWAIGTGETATPEQAQAVHAFIRDRLAAVSAEAARRVSILYGGSVKPDNAARLFACDDIDGGLIGGAALDAKSFLAICQAFA